MRQDDQTKKLHSPPEGKRISYKNLKISSAPFISASTPILNTKIIKLHEQPQQSAPSLKLQIHVKQELSVTPKPSTPHHNLQRKALNSSLPDKHVNSSFNNNNPKKYPNTFSPQHASSTTHFPSDSNIVKRYELLIQPVTNSKLHNTCKSSTPKEPPVQRPSGKSFYHKQKPVPQKQQQPQHQLHNNYVQKQMEAYANQQRPKSKSRSKSKQTPNSTHKSQHMEPRNNSKSAKQKSGLNKTMPILQTSNQTRDRSASRSHGKYSIKISNPNNLPHVSKASDKSGRMKKVSKKPVYSSRKETQKQSHKQVSGKSKKSEESLSKPPFPTQQQQEQDTECRNSALYRAFIEANNSAESKAESKIEIELEEERPSLNTREKTEFQRRCQQIIHERYLLEQKHKQRVKAATVIQAWFRGYKARKEVFEEYQRLLQGKVAPFKSVM